MINTRDIPTHVAGQDPFFDILCGTTIPGFLAGNRTV